MKRTRYIEISYVCFLFIFQLVIMAGSYAVIEKSTVREWRYYRRAVARAPNISG
jgi:hypothetical protein